VDLRAPEVPLGDGVVELRLLSGDDAPAFLDGLRDRAVAHYAYSDQLDAEETAVREHIARVPDRVAADDAVLLAVLDAATGAFIGKTMLFHVDRDNRSAELGFWLSPVSRGRGLAARAIGLTVRWAFDELGLERIQGLTDVENETSQRVMERVGFVREGTLRGAERRADGTRRDLVSYSALVTDHTNGGP
jgi:RimJ/RimL family protein N-acetyltransferase